MSVAITLGRFAGGVLRRPLLRRSLSTQTQSTTKQNLPYLMLIDPQKPHPLYLYNPSTQSISRQTPTAGASFLRHHHPISTSHGFVFCVDHATADFRGVDPLTGAHLPLPSSATSLPGISGVLRDPLLDADGGITGFVYSRPPTVWINYTSAQYVTRKPQPPSPLPDHEIHVIDCPFMVHSFYKKAVLSPSLDVAAVIVCYGPNPFVSSTAPGLAFAQLPAASSSSWCPLSFHIDDNDEASNNDHDNGFKDILFHNGKLHAINKAGTLAVFDLNGNDPNAAPFVSPKGPLGDQKGMLVESPAGDELFLVLRVMGDKCNTKGFNVFKLDKQSYDWQQVDGIGELAMFVDSRNSVAVSARDFPSLKPNSIYFFRTNFKAGEGRKDDGIFSLKDGTIERFNHGRGDLQYFYPLQWFMPATC